MGLNDAAYSYTRSNLLVERYHYMYAPYEGPRLLRAYLKQRADMAARLKSEPFSGPGAETAGRLEAALQSGEPPGEPHAPPPPEPGSSGFVTREVLLALWSAPLNRETSSWIELLVKRFEVTKRLYAAYDSRLKPASERYDELENYALLAGLLLLHYRRRPNLKLLNAALKLLDLLGSVPGALGPWAGLTAAAAEAEIRAVRDLMAKHGVAL